MTAGTPLLDQAVRAFRDLNPMRWPCVCIGCVIAIRRNYAGLLNDGVEHLRLYATNGEDEVSRIPTNTLTVEPTDG